MQFLQVDLVVYDHGDAHSLSDFYIKLYWKSGKTKVVYLPLKAFSANSFYRAEATLSDELEPIENIKKIHFGMRSGHTDGLKLSSLCFRALDKTGKLKAIATLLYTKKNEDSSGWIDAEPNAPGEAAIKLRIIQDIIAKVVDSDYPDIEINVGGRVSQGLCFEDSLGWIVSQRGDPKYQGENVHFLLNCIPGNANTPNRRYQIRFEPTHAQDLGIESIENNRCRVYTIAPYGDSNWYKGKSSAFHGIASYILEKTGQRRFLKEHVWSAEKLIGSGSPGLTALTPNISTDKKTIFFAGRKSGNLEVYKISKEDLFASKVATKIGLFEGFSEWWLQGIAASKDHVFVLLGNNSRASPKVIITYSNDSNSLAPILVCETQAGLGFVRSNAPNSPLGGYSYWELEGLEIHHGYLWTVANMPHTGKKAIVCVGAIREFTH